MYFESRAHAGQKLAAELLEKYRFENCAVVALSDGGVIVGEQIAAALHSVLTMIIAEDIDIPGEGLSFGGVSHTGSFVQNSEFTNDQMQGYVSEYHGYLEEQKREAFQRINRLLGDGGIIDAELLRDRTVILVSDGFSNATIVDVALNFLKPIRVNKLIVAAPVASEEVINKLHMSADELHILDVKTNFFDTNHYYDDNEIPSREDTIKKINNIILNWK
ncbi:hypothetical protein KI440_03430 [Candidatus Saccharibacteria bacterium TM7i]|nr:hypothetical protein KI440_03430 [Candidatus Saccharibacteria bacterium TM7i]